MNQSLQIGPMSLPYAVLLTLAAIALGGYLAMRLARTSDAAAMVDSTLPPLLQALQKQGLAIVGTFASPGGLTACAGAARLWLFECPPRSGRP